MLRVSISQYHKLYEALDRPSLYAAPWWLEAVCGPQAWDVVIQNDADGNAVAAFPYYRTRIRGLSAVITPPLTQWVPAIAKSKDTILSYQAFLPALPKTSILDLTILPDQVLLWQDTSFPVFLKYSFIIPVSSTMDQVRGGYNEGLRRNLKQAEKSYSIHNSDDVPGFLSLCQETYQQRKMAPPSWLHQVVPSVFAQLTLHQCGNITFASVQDKVVAAILTAWDQGTSYYLAGGRTSDDRGASAHALLLDHAIQEAQRHGRIFDFEGSMHPGIANFFQSFGAEPTSYWQVRKFRGLGRVWALFH